MLIQALSIVSPNGTRIAQGIKRIEVRRWKPESLPIENLLIVENSRFLHSEGDVDADGHAVAVVRITDVHPWRREEVEAACASHYEEGYWAWTIEGVRPVEKPFRTKAQRKIYLVDADRILLSSAICSLRNEDPASDWPFDQPRNCAVFSLRSIVFEGKPILWVSHDADDQGWQFLDGQVADLTEAAIVSLENIVKKDQSLLEIADLPPGWKAWRESASSPWHREREHS